MILMLRILLIASIALAPLLAGLPTAPADSSDVACLRASSPTKLDGSREDDAGALAEQFEEDDIEQEQGRALHLLAIAAAPPSLTAPGRFFGATTRAVPRATCSRPHCSRGPPRGC